MSFGFGVGDFITVIQLAHKTRKDFADAPTQFQALSKEVHNLSLALQDADVAFAHQDFHPQGCIESEINQIRESCECALTEMQQHLDKYKALDSTSNATANSKGSSKSPMRLKIPWKRLLWDPKEVESFRCRLTSNITMLNNCRTRVTNHQINELVRWQKGRDFVEFLDWLSPIDYAAEQARIIEQHQVGTCRWLLESSEFRTWCEKPQQTLVCPGTPGVGKTVAMAVAVDTLQREYSSRSDVGIACLFCSFRRKHQQDLKSLLLGILKQLLNGYGRVPDGVQKVYDDYIQGKGKLSVETIVNMLVAVTGKLTISFILVDALDECEMSNRDRDKLLQEIFGLQQKHEVRFFATTRYVPEIQSQFEGIPSLHAQATREDIGEYIRDHIRGVSACLSRNLKLQEEVITGISAAAEGMFLLAKLYLRSLDGKMSPKAIRKALDTWRARPSGPAAYDQAYELFMDRIERKMQDERNFAKKVLAWLSCTKNELTVRQLQHALGVEEDEDKDLDRDNLPDAEDLVSACTGLVVIDQPTGVVRLVHHTTDEYFARNWEKWFSTAHREIATTCLRYASYTPLQSCCATKEDLTERLQRYPLYGYVATYWGDHAREQMPLKDLVLGFLRPPTRLSALTQAAVKHLFGSADLSASPQDIHGLHVAAYFGLVEIVTTLIEEGVTVSVRDSAGETALMWAARGGHAAMADLLLTTDLDPNIRNNAGQTAIDVACKRNNKAFVCRLLEVRVDIATSVRNLMVWAAENGYQDVVTLLLDQGHSPNFHPRDLVRRRPPLIWAIIRGHDDLARLLLEHGADVEQEDKAGHTAIIAAVRFARRDLIRPILDRGTDPCEGSEGYVSAVEQTVSHSDFESMELILQDQERRGQGKKTCITLMLSAMRWNNVNVMKRMIELGMGVNEFCLRGDTPLLLASRLVVIDAISLFLDHGADPNVADQDGKRPLSLVASFDIFSWPPALKYSPNETLEMAVNLLVEKGAVVDIRDNKQQTPLILAAHHHNEGVIGALIKHGADVMAEDQSGRTVLSRLAGGSRCGVYDPTAIAQLIIDQGADIHQMDHTGRSAASHAAEKGQAGILQLLIEKGNNINTPDHHGKTPLLWATTQNKNVCAVMEVLFDSGTDPNLCDQDGRTPLIEAVVHESHYLKDRKKKVTLLLDHGADLHLRDSQGRTALSYAAAYRDTEIVRLLVDWGADIGTEDNEGRTPLFYAVQKPALAWMEKSHEPLEVLKSLLSKKIDATTLVEES